MCSWLALDSNCVYLEVTLYYLVDVFSGIWKAQKGRKLDERKGSKVIYYTLYSSVLSCPSPVQIFSLLFRSHEKTGELQFNSAPLRWLNYQHHHHPHLRPSLLIRKYLNVPVEAQQTKTMANQSNKFGHIICIKRRHSSGGRHLKDDGKSAC